MKPTRENYEAFFLDYHEGNLTESQIEELMNFLALHPDLKEELDAFEMVMLADENSIVLENKDALKKEDDALLTSMIAWHENDLNDKEKAQLEKTLTHNTNAQKDFALVGKARLQPDIGIVYPNKSSLKRFTLTGRFSQLQRFAAAAAVLAFIATLYFTLPDMMENKEDLIATTESFISTDEFSSPVLPDTDTSVPQALEPKPRTPAVIQPELIQQEKNPESIETKEKETILVPRLKSNKIAAIEPVVNTKIEMQTPVLASIDLKDDFYWFSYIGNTEYEDDVPEERIAPLQNPLRQTVTSLASLAYDGIERNTGIDIQNVENRIADRNYGLWDLAGYGLAGIGQLTGTSLTLERERDENGRVVALAIGERFRISR
jgi:hypothetical protein